MPRDILSDSLAVLRIVEHEDEENWPLEDKTACKKNKTITNVISTENGQKHPKDDCPCYYNFAAFLSSDSYYVNVVDKDKSK